MPTTTDQPPVNDRQANRRFGIDLARAFGGAIIFGLPLLMTMEMWWLGFYMDRVRLALFLVLILPMLVGLSYHSGFKKTFRWRDDILDAFVAYAVGYVAGAVGLYVLAILQPGMSIEEIVGKISLQAVPGAIGALLAQSQFGSAARESGKTKETRYIGEVFLMAAGAVFLGFNLAPTEEMVLIAYMMTPGRVAALAVVSILVMHAFVYAVEFRGQASIPRGTPLWSIFLRYTVVGYAVVLLISLYLLWTFGRTDGTSPEGVLTATLVLAFPGALGAAAARLIL